MKLIYLPKTQYRYRREVDGPNRKRFDRHWMSRAHRRQRYWGLMHSFLLFAFLIVAVRVAFASLSCIRPESQSGLSVETPRALNAVPIQNETPRLNIRIDRDGRFQVGRKNIVTLNNLSYLLYDRYDQYPDEIPVIIADYYASMNDIIYVVRSLEIAGYKKIIFRTHSPGLMSR